MVQNMYHLAYDERRGLLNLHPLEFRRVRYDLLTTRRILLGQYGTDLLRFFTLVGESRTRGHEFKLQKPRRLKLGANSTLSTRVVNLWNALPPELLAIQSELQFKDALDAHLWRHWDECSGAVLW